MPIPTGTEQARPFLPSKDFAASKSFYERVGFKKLLDTDVAIFEMGASTFILQNYFKKEWAENCMMQLMVDDLDAWWMHIEALDLVGTFGVANHDHQRSNLGDYAWPLYLILRASFGTSQSAAKETRQTDERGLLTPLVVGSHPCLLHCRVTARCAPASMGGMSVAGGSRHKPQNGGSSFSPRPVVSTVSF
jgi:hypothetical protein